jgi:hypothetical protein
LLSKLPRGVAPHHGQPFRSSCHDDVFSSGTLKGRRRFVKDVTVPLFDAKREGHKVSQGMRDAFWFQRCRPATRTRLVV